MDIVILAPKTVIIKYVSMIPRSAQLRRKIDNKRGHIHTFVFTYLKNNWFQKILIMQNTNIRICAPLLAIFLYATGFAFLSILCILSIRLIRFYFILDELFYLSIFLSIKTKHNIHSTCLVYRLRESPGKAQVIHGRYSVLILTLLVFKKHLR